MASENRTLEKIGAVNGLRGIATILVVIFHLFSDYTAHGALHAGQIDGDGLLAALINQARLGVDMFFVLSGFVLYLPYRTEARRMQGFRDIWSFYLHRAQRLLPLYYIVVIVTVSLHAKHPAGSTPWFLEFAGLLSTLFTFSAHGFLPPSNVVLWSISVEIWFSVLFPAFVFAMRRWPITHVVAATVATSIAFRYIGQHMPVERVGEFRPFTMGLFRACQEFVLGMLACHLYVGALQDAGLRARSLRLMGPGLIIAVATYVLWPNLAVHPAIKGLTFSIGFTMLLVGLVSRPNPLSSLLQLWPLQLIGCMCYSIYAWHNIILREMIPPATSGLDDTLSLMIPYLSVVVGLSALSYRYIEFGREQNWRRLFLIADPAQHPAPTRSNKGWSTAGTAVADSKGTGS